MKDKKKILGKIIRNIRTINGVTQGCLCNSVEISQSVLSKIELGKATIDIENYRKILSFFNTNYEIDFEIEQEINDICNNMFREFENLSMKSMQQYSNELLILKEKNRNIILDYKIQLFLYIPKILEGKTTEIIGEFESLIEIFEGTDDESYIIGQLTKVFYLINHTKYREAKEIIYDLDKIAQKLNMHTPLITFNKVYIEIMLNNKLIAFKLLSQIEEGCTVEYLYLTSINIVNFSIGFLYQQNEDYFEALKYYDLVNDEFITNLIPKLRNFYFMNKTYCKYKLGNDELTTTKMIKLILEAELSDPLFPLFLIYQTALNKKDFEKVKKIMEISATIENNTYGKHLFTLESLRNNDELFYEYVEKNLFDNQYYKNYYLYFNYILELRDHLWKSKQYSKFKYVSEYLVNNIQ